MEPDARTWDKAVARRMWRTTHRLKTQRVTWRPFSRHFSGLGSFFLQLRKATFSGRHRTAMCLDAAISTDDVGIGSPEASTGVLLADIAAGVGPRRVLEDSRLGDLGARGPEQMEKGRLGAGGGGGPFLCQCSS